MSCQECPPFQAHNLNEEMNIPPRSFAMVSPGIYRCGYPHFNSFPFLKKLKLRSIICLCEEDYLPDNLQFTKDNNINFFQCGFAPCQEPFISVPSDKLCAAVSYVLDKKNHPILVHCNDGKHRTGVVVGCIRRFQQQSLTSIYGEYRRFTGANKMSLLDKQVIELFDTSKVTLSDSHPT